MHQAIHCKICIIQNCKISTHCQKNQQTLIANILVTVSENEVRFLVCEFHTHWYLLKNFQRKTQQLNFWSTKGLTFNRVLFTRFVSKPILQQAGTGRPSTLPHKHQAQTQTECAEHDEFMQIHEGVIKSCNSKKLFTHIINILKFPCTMVNSFLAQW